MSLPFSRSLEFSSRPARKRGSSQGGRWLGSAVVLVLIALGLGAQPASAQTTLPAIELGPIVGTTLSQTNHEIIAGVGASVSVLSFGIEGTAAFAPIIPGNLPRLNAYSYDVALTHSIIPVPLPVQVYGLAGVGFLHYPNSGGTAAHTAKTGLVGLGLRVPFGPLAIRPEVRVGGAGMSRVTIGLYFG